MTDIVDDIAREILDGAAFDGRGRCGSGGRVLRPGGPTALNLDRQPTRRCQKRDEDKGARYGELRRAGRGGG